MEVTTENISPGEVTLELIAMGLIDLNSFNENGLKPLHQAVMRNNISRSKILIACGSNVNEFSKSGESCLSIAIDLCNVHMVKMLLLNNANIMKSTHRGKGALQIICEKMKNKFKRHEKYDKKIQMQNILQMILENGIVNKNT